MGKHFGRFLVGCVLVGCVVCTGVPQTSQQGAKPAMKDSAQVQAVRYVCPMDKDVVAAKPGKCPKCGMTLQKISPAVKKTPPGDSQR